MRSPDFANLLLLLQPNRSVQVDLFDVAPVSVCISACVVISEIKKNNSLFYYFLNYIIATQPIYWLLTRFNN